MTQLAQDQAKEVLRLLKNAGLYVGLTNAARAAEVGGVNAGWVDVGGNSSTLDAFFANCSYFGVDANQARKAYSAESGRQALINAGVLSEEGHLNVGEIVRIAGPQQETATARTA